MPRRRQCKSHFGNAAPCKLLLEVIVHGEFPIIGINGDIAKDSLHSLLSGGAVIYLHDFVNAEIHLAVGVVFSVWYYTARVQTEQARFSRDFQHIILARIHGSAVNRFGALGKNLHIRFLFIVRAGNDGLRLSSLQFRDRQIKHIRRPYVCEFLEHLHEFGDIVEFSKALFRAIAVARRLQLCL